MVFVGENFFDGDRFQIRVFLFFGGKDLSFLKVDLKCRYAQALRILEIFTQLLVFFGFCTTVLRFLRF